MMLKVTPNIKACLFLILPIGIGLKHVLDIKASRSDSYHIFKAPAAPAPKETAKRDIVACIKPIFPGAKIKPTKQVNKTKDITLGFISFIKGFKLTEKKEEKNFVFTVVGINLFYFR